MLSISLKYFLDLCCNPTCLTYSSSKTWPPSSTKSDPTGRQYHTDVDGFAKQADTKFPVQSAHHELFYSLIQNTPYFEHLQSSGTSTF